jgi:hypothetical protein
MNMYIDSSVRTLPAAGAVEAGAPKPNEAVGAEDGAPKETGAPDLCIYIYICMCLYVYMTCTHKHVHIHLYIDTYMNI